MLAVALASKLLSLCMELKLIRNCGTKEVQATMYLYNKTIHVGGFYKIPVLLCIFITGISITWIPKIPVDPIEVGRGEHDLL